MSDVYIPPAAEVDAAAKAIYTSHDLERPWSNADAMWHVVCYREALAALTAAHEARKAAAQ